MQYNQLIMNIIHLQLFYSKIHSICYSTIHYMCLFHHTLIKLQL